jgi:hypothetical protein
LDPAAWSYIFTCEFAFLIIAGRSGARVLIGVIPMFFFFWDAINFRELEREKAWSRIYLLPALMAEGDRDLYRRRQAMMEREREIMKEVPGWEVSTMVAVGTF